jgi:sugar phosphate isomerase/epimerase
MKRAGLCTIAFKTRAVEDVVSIAADTGASCLELWGQPPHVSYPIDQAELEALGQTAQSRGVPIVTFGSYFQPGKDVVFDGVAVTIENQVLAASRVGATLIRIWPGSKDPAGATANEKRRWYEEIRRFADAAAEAGIDTVLERHSGTLTHGWNGPFEALGEIDHPHVHLNYQIAYPMPVNEYPEHSVADYLRLLPLSRHAHIQNYIETPAGPLKRTLLDRGVVDYSRLGTACTEADYPGSLMIEFPADIRGGMNAVDAVAADIAYLDSLGG